MGCACPGGRRRQTVAVWHQGEMLVVQEVLLCLGDLVVQEVLEGLDFLDGLEFLEIFNLIDLVDLIDLIKTATTRA